MRLGKLLLCRLQVNCHRVMYCRHRTTGNRHVKVNATTSQRQSMANGLNYDHYPNRQRHDIPSPSFSLSLCFILPLFLQTVPPKPVMWQSGMAWLNLWSRGKRACLESLILYFEGILRAILPVSQSVMWIRSYPREVHRLESNT